MIFRENGNVGTVTGIPTSKLHVMGNIKVEGSIMITSNQQSSVQQSSKTKMSLKEQGEYLKANKKLPSLSSNHTKGNEVGYGLVSLLEQVLIELEKAHFYTHELSEKQKEILKQNALYLDRVNTLKYLK